MRLPIFLVLCSCAMYGVSANIFLLDRQMHPSPPKRLKSRMTDVESTVSYWHGKAQTLLKQKLQIKHNKNIAKNVIMFLGDGMSIPTLAATRMYMGAEEDQLTFEKFHYTALSKTYCVDSQTADSACSATAYLGGVKGNIATIGVTAAVELNDCNEMIKEKNQVHSIAKWSQDAGKRTGIVTTSTVTDASPSGTYAHTANRLWQNDTAVTEAGENATRCRDIAHQLIKGTTGSKFNVILGGGTEMFLPIGDKNEAGSEGTRSDRKNLIKEWLKDKKDEFKNAKYVWNRSQLLNIRSETDYVLGLFSDNYMPYNLDRNESFTPSLAEMTEAAIKIVSRGNGAENGFFLFVESGRIDHGHHAALAHKALDETVELSKALQKALDMTDQTETLIVVTSDHAHTMSMSGYPERNNGIFSMAGEDEDGFGYLTLNYANGPGYKEKGHRVQDDDTNDKDYQFPGVYNLTSETHGADDVAIFANGPWAHLYSGVIEENAIPHFMAYASCVGPGLTTCSKSSVNKNNPSSSSSRSSTSRNNGDSRKAVYGNVDSTINNNDYRNTADDSSSSWSSVGRNNYRSPDSTSRDSANENKGDSALTRKSVYGNVDSTQQSREPAGTKGKYSL